MTDKPDLITLAIAAVVSFVAWSLLVYAIAWLAAIVFPEFSRFEAVLAGLLFVLILRTSK